MTDGHKDFDAKVKEFDGTDKLIIIDFFMPACGWCVKFMPEWN